MSSIVVAELEYAPPGADSLFFDVGFGVSPGEHAALVGANGVGKSTILRILSGQLLADEGEFSVGGTVLTMTQDVGMSNPDDSLREMLPAVRWHHENWNGRGYPHGLRGEDIPLTARIVAVADCFDAITTSRRFPNPLLRDLLDRRRPRPGG